MFEALAFQHDSGLLFASHFIVVYCLKMPNPSAYAFQPRYTDQEIAARSLDSTTATSDDEQQPQTPSSTSTTSSDPEAAFDSFCQCGCCYDFQGIPSVVEQRCCASEDLLAAYFSDHKPGSCILNTREMGIVLSAENAQLAWYRERQYMGYRGQQLCFDLMTNTNYRYHAYRSYISYMHGRLGPRNRRVIPACVVAKIRSLWPSEDGTYVGYKACDDGDGEPQDELVDAIAGPD